MKTKMPFETFLREPLNKKVLHKNGISIKHFTRPKLNLYVVQNHQGEPLCLFEVGKEFARSSSSQDTSLLKQIPSYYLKLPGYRILYQRSGEKENGSLSSFNVRKMTPKERFVGDFSPRDFMKFMAATITYCRKENRNGRNN